MSGEWFGHLMQRLLEQGALDVAYAPITMKKSRPAVAVSIIARLEDEEKMASIMLKESTTLGVRVTYAKRYTLAREMRKVNTPYGAVSVKIAGGRAAPEYDECAAIARQSGVALWEVYQAAQRAAYEDERGHGA